MSRAQARVLDKRVDRTRCTTPVSPDMQRVGLLARASTAVCSGVLGAGRAGDCAASTSYAQSLPWTQSWQAQPCRPSTALTTSSSSSSSSVAAVTKSLLVDTLALVRCDGDAEALNFEGVDLSEARQRASSS